MPPPKPLPAPKTQPTKEKKMPPLAAQKVAVSMGEARAARVIRKAPSRMAVPAGMRTWMILRVMLVAKGGRMVFCGKNEMVSAVTQT
jgi:hypothetical protein